MAVPSGSLIRCAVRLNAGVAAGDVVNVYHFETQSSAPLDEADLADEVVAYFEALYTTLETLMDDGYTPQDIKIDIVEFQLGVPVITANVGTYTWGGTFAPSSGSDGLPPGSAALVKGLTSLGKVYGRKFLSGLVSTVQANGILEGTVLTALANYAAQYLDGHTFGIGDRLIPGVMSKRLGQFAPLISAVVSTNMAYQRRRRKGTGS